MKRKAQRCKGVRVSRTRIDRLYLGGPCRKLTRHPSGYCPAHQDKALQRMFGAANP